MLMFGMEAWQNVTSGYSRASVIGMSVSMLMNRILQPLRIRSRMGCSDSRAHTLLLNTTSILFPYSAWSARCAITKLAV